jgi:hypothetical protein
MRGSICVTLALVSVAGWSRPVLGQDARPVRQVGTARPSQPQQLPYTAEFKTTHVRILADGSTITHETTEALARDSQGRSFQLSSSSSTGDEQTLHTSVNINDPVAHTHTFWFSPGQRVTVTTTPELGSPRASCGANLPAPVPASPERRQAKSTSEDLGLQMFEGVEAHGNRSSRTIPPGAIGNSEQLVRTDEVWFTTTPCLAGINVRQVVDDPETGKMTRELVRFTPGEPDMAAFQPPEGYETVTQEVHNEVRCP